MPERISSPRDVRRHHRSGSRNPEDKRSPAQRDRDRLLYSSAFRRLAEVTQVVAANSGYVFHNRLTHSLQVAQVGRRLAEKLLRELPPSLNFPQPSEILDPDVVEAASLAHDLGHPPFGHVVEDELNELSKKIGGYEGNAQSFRIVTKLAFHSPDYDGLNLCGATLSALLKYPWTRGMNPDKQKKWGAYESEAEDFQFARSLYSHGFEQSPEAFLMDWADDITYSVHDLEDFYRAGRIPLHLLSTTDSREREYFRQNVLHRHENSHGDPYIVENIDDLMDKLATLLIYTFPSMQAYRGTKAQRSGLRTFSGALIDRYINAAEWNVSGEEPRPVVAKEYRDEVLMLKELTWTYVIQDPALATQQLGQRHMIRILFDAYANASGSSQGLRMFPPFYQERLDEAVDENARLRICIDLIAGMTENQVQRIYARMIGSSAESSLSDPLR